MNTSEILNTAADEIQRDGLWKGGTVSGGSCAANAICHAVSAGPGHVNAGHRAFLAYLRMPNLGVGAIFAWNDAPERTAEDVVVALRAAAAIEESREALAAAGVSA